MHQIIYVLSRDQFVEKQTMQNNAKTSETKELITSVNARHERAFWYLWKQNEKITQEKCLKAYNVQIMQGR